MNNDLFINEIFQSSIPLENTGGILPLIEDLGKKRIVMLGEASHGTEEFYEWRRRISMELIRHHGFSFIAVEGDWPACQGVNDYIQGKDSADAISAMTNFSRWPTWMWANTLIMDFMDELREWNDLTDNPVGFHGLDVYSLYDSLDQVVRRLDEINPEVSGHARKYYSCFDPHRHDERAYLRSLYHLPRGCSEEVISALQKILETKLDDKDDALDIIQNARIIRNAENYYRAMISPDDDSWNVRDRHMMETLDVLLNHYGPESRGIVWAHNTHIGDYRTTDMLARGDINIGGLAREKYGNEEVALIGFSTYKGDVIASREWDGPIEVMEVPEAKHSSLEWRLHSAVPVIGHRNFFLDMRNLKVDSLLNGGFTHRAIGVVYDPENEHWGNYVPTIPAKRYDGIIFCDETTALKPLNVNFLREKIPETFPHGKTL